MKRQLGFTLVELMIVIAVLAFLILATVPLTGAWVQSADVTEVHGDFTEAVGRAKAAAMRNSPAITGNNPVTAICISNTKVLSVLENNGANTPNCTANTGKKLWSTQLDTDVNFTSAGAAVSCMCFDNKGLLTTQACAGCLSVTNFTVASGSENDTVYIY